MNNNNPALLKCPQMHRSHDGAEGFQDHKIFDSRVLYKWVSRNFVTQGLFDFIMARIQLLLLALLASSIFVRAKSVSYQYGDIREASGRFKLIVKFLTVIPLLLT